MSLAPMEAARPPRVQILVLAAVLAAPLAVPTAEPLALLLWLTLLAAPCGALLARERRGWVAPVIVLFAALLTWCALPAPGLQRIASTTAALVGLGLLGAAPALRSRPSGFSLPAVALLVGALLGALPSLGGLWRGAPWPPVAAARLLDLSPLSLTVESAGVDWMRHSFVYEPAGTASIGPELRSAWGGLAGPACFVVGCAFVIAAHVCRRRDAVPESSDAHR